MSDDRILRIRITAPEKGELTRLLLAEPMDLGCSGPQRREGKSVSVEAFVPEKQLERLRRYAVQVDVIADATAVGRARQQEVGRGNRYANRNEVPRGIGRKTKN